MRKYLLRPLLFLLLLPVLCATGCTETYDSNASYFNGTILAQYQQPSSRDANDNLTLTFYEPGFYHVAFSQTPGKIARSGHGPEVMPKDFDITLDRAPRVRVIAQYVLPDFLRVTITHDGSFEFYDF